MEGCTNIDKKARFDLHLPNHFNPKPRFEKKLQLVSVADRNIMKNIKSSTRTSEATTELMKAVKQETYGLPKNNIRAERKYLWLVSWLHNDILYDVGSRMLTEGP